MSDLIATWASTSAGLADGLDATVTGDTVLNNGPLILDDVPVEVATPLTGSDPGAIASVVFVVRARIVGVAGGATAHHVEMFWTDGPHEEVFGAGPTVVGDFVTYRTDPIPTAPSGLPWTAARLSALTAVGIRGLVHMPGPFSTLTLEVSEISAELMATLLPETGIDVSVCGDDLLAECGAGDVEVNVRTDNPLAEVTA